MMRIFNKIFMVLGIVVFLGKAVNASKPAWLFNADKPVTISGHQVDNKGNHFILGELTGDSLWMNDSLIMVNKGSKGDFNVPQNDLFLCKIDNQGNLAYLKHGWSGKSAKDSNADVSSQALALDGQGHVIIAGGGINNQSLHFDNITFHFDTASAHLFIFKLDKQNGGLTWMKYMKAQAFGKPGRAKVTGIASNSTGEIVLSGYYWLRLVVESDTLKYVYPSVHDVNGFVIKLSDKGNLVWSKGLIASDFTYCNGVAYDHKAAYYVYGSVVSNSLILGSDTLTSDGEYSEPYIAKLDEQGRFLWARQAKNTGFNDRVIDVALDAAGGVYCLGNYSGDDIHFENQILTNNAAGRNFFLTKYKSNGALAWAKTGKGRKQQTGMDLAIHGNAYGVIGGKVRSDTVRFSNVAVSNNTNKPNPFLFTIALNGQALNGHTYYQDFYFGSISRNPSAANSFYLNGTITDTLKVGKQRFVSPPPKASSLFVPWLADTATRGSGYLKESGFRGTVYPNPFDNRLRVHIPEQDFRKGLVLRLYNTKGRVVKTSQFNEPKAFIATNRLPSGCYYLTIYHHGNLLSSEKVIKR